MKVYTYSEARRRHAQVLDEAKTEGAVRITRRGGDRFIIQPTQSGNSPLDVPGVETGLSREDTVSALREARKEER